MSVIFADVADSGLRGSASDLSGLSYPFTVLYHIKHFHANGWGCTLAGIADNGNYNYRPVMSNLTSAPNMEFRTGIGNIFGTTTYSHTTTIADAAATQAMGWQPIYVIAIDDDNVKVFFQGTEETFTGRDIFSHLVGDMIPEIGVGGRNRCEFAHYAVFNRELTAPELALISTNTPDNLGGALPMYYQRLNDSGNDGIGAALTDLNSDAVYNSGSNPSLTGPTPVTPLFTSGPTATSIGETIVTASGTADEDCTVQVVVVTSGAGQPSDATFDGSSFSQFSSADTAFNINVTGLTGQTNYDLWVRLKPNVGTSTYGSDAFLTTPAAPTITAVNGGNPITNSGSYIILGSGFTGHTAADIDGTAQTGFTVDSDTQVTITTAVHPAALKFGESALFNIGGTTFSVTMEPATGFSYVDITSVETGSLNVDETMQVGWQIEYDNDGGNILVHADGTASMATFTSSTTGRIHDGTSYAASATINFSSAVDTTPDPFSFTDLVDREPNVAVYSETITISGINASASVSITGGSFSIDGGPSLTSGTIDNGQDIRLLQTSSATFGASVSATITIGGVQDTWSLTTRDANTLPTVSSFTPIQDAELNTLYSSEIITIAGLEEEITITLNGSGEHSLNGGTFVSTALQANNGDTYQVRRVSSPSYNTNVSLEILFATHSSQFDIDTRLIQEIAFTAITDAETSQVIESETITIVGDLTSANASIVGGEMSINSGAYTSVTSPIDEGDTVQVRLTSSPSALTESTLTLTVAGYDSIFSVTTGSSGLSTAEEYLALYNQLISDLSDTNTNCTNCDGCMYSVDCTDCDDSSYLTRCQNCVRCRSLTDCNSCTNCTNSQNCTDLIESSNCVNCHQSSKLSGCTNCLLCHGMTDISSGYWLLNEQVTQQEFESVLAIFD